MTALIIILTITNIGIGYGLAIYLGRTQSSQSSTGSSSYESFDNSLPEQAMLNDVKSMRTEAATVAAEAPAAEETPAIGAELLEGIDKFQNQLNSQQERSKLPALTNSSEDE